jgi:hypothetical protein
MKDDSLLSMIVVSETQLGEIFSDAPCSMVDSLVAGRARDKSYGLKLF